MRLSNLRTKLRESFLRRWSLLEFSRFGQASYAQEGEDRMLHRMMDKNHSRGFYVDVGCNHPFRMSNTALFYQAGWTGVAIDPNPDYAMPFQQLRPKDKFVNCGVGFGHEKLLYHRFAEPLYNTFDKEKASDVARNKSSLISTDEVSVRRLDGILNDSWPEGKSIRFLSIDCEGMDEQVLRSHDFDKFPVEFLCIEQDQFLLRDALEKPAVKLAEGLGFVVVGKSTKSMILVSSGKLDSWRL